MKIGDFFSHPLAALCEIADFCGVDLSVHIPHGVRVARLKLVAFPVDDALTPSYVLCIGFPLFAERYRLCFAHVEKHFPICLKVQPRSWHVE